MKKLLRLFVSRPLAVSLFVGLAAQDASAQSVPPIINYQGKLSNPDGSPLPTGDYQLTFRIYDSATNASGLVWGPQIFDGQVTQGHGSSIPAVQGYFNVMLGPADANGTPLDSAFTNSNRFVEITISNHPPILPRQQILSAPFAFNSARLAGYDWSALFGTNDPVNGKLPGPRISDGSVTLGKLSSRQTGTNVGSIALSAACLDFVNDSTTPLDVTNLVVTLCTSGRPVLVFLTGMTNGPFGGSVVGRWFSGTPFAAAEFRLLRDGVPISQQEVAGYATTDYNAVGAPSGSVSGIDFPPAGCHTYKLQCFAATATRGSRVVSSVLVAFEL